MKSKLGFTYTVQVLNVGAGWHWYFLISVASSVLTCSWEYGSRQPHKFQYRVQRAAESRTHIMAKWACRNDGSVFLSSHCSPSLAHPVLRIHENSAISEIFVTFITYKKSWAFCYIKLCYKFVILKRIKTSKLYFQPFLCFHLKFAPTETF